MTDDELLLETDYTSYANSCRDPHVAPGDDLVECRRQRGNEATTTPTAPAPAREPSAGSPSKAWDRCPRERRAATAPLGGADRPGMFLPGILLFGEVAIELMHDFRPGNAVVVTDDCRAVDPARPAIGEQYPVTILHPSMMTPGLGASQSPFHPSSRSRDVS